MSIDIKDLVKARVHFGHRTTKWNPRMAPFIWGTKNNIHLINVSKTAVLLEQAAQFLEKVAGEGKTILWVGTKKPAQAKIAEVAQKLESPYVVHRWIGGSLTNFPQVKKSVTKMLHYEDILEKADRERYTKKELNRFSKIASKLQNNIGGIRALRLPVGALVVVDVMKEKAAIKEALNEGVPVVALIDTNGDPSGIQFVVPCNDDAVSSINIVTDYLADAAGRGVQKASQERAKAREAEALKKQEAAKLAKSQAQAPEAKEESASAKETTEKSKVEVKVKPAEAKAAKKEVVKEVVEVAQAAEPVKKETAKTAAPKKVAPKKATPAAKAKKPATKSAKAKA
ncbi:MAG: 30S ribosomal protein S2 [Candidatus Babeliales bacterium]